MADGVLEACSERRCDLQSLINYGCGSIIIISLAYILVHVYGYEADHYRRHHGDKKNEWQKFKEEHLNK